MLLRGDTHHEGWDVDHLLADSNMSLANENTSMMNAASEVALLNEGLKSSLKELRGGQTKDIIELALIVFQETESDHTANQGLTWN